MRLLGQQRQVEAGVAAAAGLAVGALAGGDVGLVADDRVEAGGLALAVELDGAVEVAVVGQGQGVHAQRLGVGDQLGDAAGAVEQAVVAVAVQVNEGTVRHGSSVVQEVEGDGALYERSDSRSAVSSADV